MNITPPHSPANEEAVIGSVMLNAQQLDEISLSPKDFYIACNEWVWEAIQAVRARGDEINIITVGTELDKRGKLAEIGGSAKLMYYCTLDVGYNSAGSYAQQIIDDSRRRRVINAMTTAVQDVFDRNRDLTAIIATLTDELSRAIRRANGAELIKEYLSIVYDQLVEAMANPQDIYGIETGLPGFDAITFGLQPGETLKLSGDPGVGKSLLAMQLACGMAKHAPGAVFQLEMSGLAVTRRRLSAVSRVPTYKFRQGKLADDEYQAVVQGIAEMENLQIYMSDSPDWTTAEMSVELQRLKANHGIRWFLIDYEGLLKDEYPGSTWWEREKRISASVHDMAKRLNLAGLIVDIKHKAGVGEKDGAQKHLAGPAAKIYDADQIVFLTCKDPVARTYVLTWEKQREGAGGKRVLELQLTQGFPAFREIVRPERSSYRAPYKED